MDPNEIIKTLTEYEELIRVLRVIASHLDSIGWILIFILIAVIVFSKD